MVLDKKEKTVVTSLRLKKSVLKKAKILAIEKETTIGKLIESLIEKELKN